MKFGRLKIVKKIGRTKDRRILFLCECDCGELIKSDSHKLNSGNTKSCGCLRVDVAREAVKKIQPLASKAASISNRTHGMRNTRFYRIWRGMLNRCNNIRNSNYGGAGVTVCEEWRTFKNFMNDMYRSYTDHCALFGETRTGTSIDRINPFGNYGKENCRWATHAEQCLNKR